MRSFMSAICVLLAMAVSVVTVPLLWVATHVADEDGYVELTEPLATDAELRKALAAYVASELVAGAGVPEQLRPVVATAIATTAGRVAGREGYVEAWNATQRRSHRLTFGDVRDLSADQDATDRFTIDLAPFATYLVSALDALPITLEVPGQLLVSVNGAPERQLVDRVKASPGYATTGSVVVGLLVVLALMLARRRSVVIVGLGVGAVVVAALVKVGVDEGVEQGLARAAAPSDLARRLQELIADRAVDSLDGWLIWLAAGGVLVMLAGALTRATSGRA